MVEVVEVGVENGSVFRKEWEAAWREALVEVTREVRFDARREDFRGGRAVELELEVEERFRFVVDEWVVDSGR